MGGAAIGLQTDVRWLATGPVTSLRGVVYVLVRDKCQSSDVLCDTINDRSLSCRC